MAKDLKVSQYLKDEFAAQRGKKKTKMQISFTLPKGAYATCVVKALFLQ
jgi:tRNA(Glu) U13 pseudouridine synthase TruD